MLLFVIGFNVYYKFLLLFNRRTDRTSCFILFFYCLCCFLQSFIMGIYRGYMFDLFYYIFFKNFIRFYVF